MKRINGLEELQRWVLDASEVMSRNMPLMYQKQQADQVVNLVDKVSEAIKDTYPFYADVLPQIIRRAFVMSPMGVCSLNLVTFGEIYIIVKHLHDEPEDAHMWAMIHPRIGGMVKELFQDGHYSAAANRCFVELEVRLRELFMLLKPGVQVSARVGDLIGALLSENGAYHFCDTSTQSGRDYRKGIQALFDGAFSAYRNPSSHENQDLSRQTAFEQITLASQLMKVLDT